MLTPGAVDRIKAAATDETLRAAAREKWAQLAPTLFAPQERTGIRTSDAGACVRALWNAVHGNPEIFTPEVQLDNLDNGTLIGCWRGCLLAASLEADGYHVELEPEVTHDGVPGHIDVYYQEPGDDHPMMLDLKPRVWTRGVVEIKNTNQAFSVKAPDELNKDGTSKQYQILQLMKYCAAKGVQKGAIVTNSPAFRAATMREDWYDLDDWMDDVIAEYERLSAALGDVEPEEDAKEAWRCRGCPVTACERNPEKTVRGESYELSTD